MTDINKLVQTFVVTVQKLKLNLSNYQSLSSNERVTGAGLWGCSLWYGGFRQVNDIPFTSLLCNQKESQR